MTSRVITSIGSAFGHALDLELVKSSSISYSQVVRNLRSLERDYVKKLKAHPEFALEIRRRIAESVLDQALLHGCNLSICRAKLSNASRLGWTDIGRKAHFHLVYARVALASGHKRVARRVAFAMVKEIQNMLDEPKNGLSRSGRKFYGELLARTVEVIDVIEGSENQKVPCTWKRRSELSTDYSSTMPRK